ncbi:MAG: type II secretion system F family protein [Coriobacteriia bacterium]|nr:type II secretion system F family protein [Coriobacteriia bacterium]
MSDLLLRGVLLAAVLAAAYLLCRAGIEWGMQMHRLRQAQRAITGSAVPLWESLRLAALVAAVLERLRRPAEIDRMRAAVPELLDQLAQTLRAGLSLSQAILRIEEQPNAALSGLLHALSVDLSLGYSVSESLERFQAKVPLPELRMVALALELQHRTGGNIAELLERSAGLQRQSLQMLRSLRAQTAQGRMSVRLVVIIPLALVAIMAVTLPDYLGSFLSSGLGLVLAALACALLGLGFIGVRRVVNIEL